jgi:hypothetical protein
MGSSKFKRAQTRCECIFRDRPIQGFFNTISSRKSLGRPTAQQPSIGVFHLTAQPRLRPLSSPALRFLFSQRAWAASQRSGPGGVREPACTARQVATERAAEEHAGGGRG